MRVAASVGLKHLLPVHWQPLQIQSESLRIIYHPVLFRIKPRICKSTLHLCAASIFAVRSLMYLGCLLI